MKTKKAYQWLNRGKRRPMVLAVLSQPLTPTQIARRTNTRVVSCIQTLQALNKHQMVYCSNPCAVVGRLYWLTDLGKICRNRLLKDNGQPRSKHLIPRIDYSLYGRLCFRQRAVVLKLLNEPIQPAKIAKLASRRQENVRMSANNVRDVIRFFKQNGIVRPIRRKKGWPRYALTQKGMQFRHC